MSSGDLSNGQFPGSPVDKAGFLSFVGPLVIDVTGFRIKFEHMSLNLNFDSIEVFINSNIFNKYHNQKPRAYEGSSFQSKLISVITRLVKFRCDKFNLIVALGNSAGCESLVYQVMDVSNIKIENNEKLCLEVLSAKLNQVLFLGTESRVESVLCIPKLELVSAENIRSFNLEIKNNLSLFINVRFLYFVSSFIKSIKTFSEDDNEDKDCSTNVASNNSINLWLRIKIPGIDFRLVLPETDSASKYFKHLQFKFENVEFLFNSYNGLIPAIGFWSETFELAGLVDEEKQIGSKYFCPIDMMLRRGPSDLSNQNIVLMRLDGVFLSNWIDRDDFPTTSVPKKVIKDWISSVINGDPICSIRNENVSVNDVGIEIELLEKFHDRNFLRSLSPEFFRTNRISTLKALNGIVNDFDFRIPFEIPISSLIDHCVVLFKAGWRPLSKKTDKGYWVGDGDKFLRSDWAFNIMAKRARLRIEDDKFEAKISAISHFQRKLAESRSRLEEAIKTDSSILGCFNFPHLSPDQFKFANDISTHSDCQNDAQAAAVIELHKDLFLEYRLLIEKSHLLTDWSLLDVCIDDLRFSMSWSMSYFGEGGLLSELLNKIENGNEISQNCISELSTFLGGFADISGSSIQINLRNFARPILIAPDLRIIGPVFLVEDGVRDPDVLIKYPVQILPYHSISNFEYLPFNGIVDVLRSILPLKLYHCVYANISRTEIVQASISPYWIGCVALLDRVIDRFVKASTEDPSPPIPGWDKLRYNIRGCHSRLRIESPCIISRIADSDPLSCFETLNLSFPSGLDIGIVADGGFVLKCADASLDLDSQYLYRIRAGLDSNLSLINWDFRLKPVADDHHNRAKNMSVSSFDLTQNAAIPIIKLTQTQLELKFVVKNRYNHGPCHHWKVKPISRTAFSNPGDWEHYDTFDEFRSKSISMEICGFVGKVSNDQYSIESDEIRFLYYRELENWIGRFLSAPFSDMDTVKRGSLHQSAAIPEIQKRTSFSNVFNEFHLSLDFADIFICRILNFIDLKESQALWSTSARSLLNMDWRKGVVDQHGREDWVYYYGELEFLDVNFCVSTNSPVEKSIETPSSEFPVKISGIDFYDLLRAPRLFYLSLDENCFKFDPESLEIQCHTILKRRQSLLESLSDVTSELHETPASDAKKRNDLDVAVQALMKRRSYYDDFLFKAQNYAFIDSDYELNSIENSEFADTTHFEIYNAQLVWNIVNRDILFKFIDEFILKQKKKFSQSRAGQMLMRKMGHAGVNATSPQLSVSGLEKNGPFERQNSSGFISPTETIDTFFENLLHRKNLSFSPTTSESSSPFLAAAEPQKSALSGIQEKQNAPDSRSPVELRDHQYISVPRVIDVSFFNPQLCLFTPTRMPSGAILLTSSEAKVEFSPLFDRLLLYSDNPEKSSFDPKIGNRTKISLSKTSVYSGDQNKSKPWPYSFLNQAFDRNFTSFDRLASDTEIVMVYDISNSAYSWTPDSPDLNIFGRGDTLRFISNGLSLTSNADNFRQLLDVIVNLMVYRDPNQEQRSEKLETLLIAANLSDRQMFSSKMGDLRLRLDSLRHRLMFKREYELSFFEVYNLLETYDITERELALIGEVMRMIQASRDQLNQKRSRLTLDVKIEKIQWELVSIGLFHSAPVCNIALRNISNRWLSKEDGSMENTFQIGSANFLNQLPAQFYRNVVRPFNFHEGQDGVNIRTTVDYGCLLRFFAKSRLPINGIPILEHVEVDLSPLQLQLTFDIATQLYKFFLPEKFKKAQTASNEDSETKSTGVLEQTMSSRQRTRTEVSDLILSEQQIHFDEVLELKKRREQNVFFVYVKVPPSQHLVSYKSSGRSSLLDIDRFVLSLPEMEYQNKLWSWPEFFNQLRKDMIVVLIKNAGSLFKDKIKKLGKKNVPESQLGPNSKDEEYFRKLARKEKIDVLENNESDEREKKNFIVFGKSLLNLMKK